MRTVDYNLAWHHDVTFKSNSGDLDSGIFLIWRTDLLVCPTFTRNNAWGTRDRRRLPIKHIFIEWNFHLMLKLCVAPCVCRMSAECPWACWQQRGGMTTSCGCWSGRAWGWTVGRRMAPQPWCMLLRRWDSLSIETYCSCLCGCASSVIVTLNYLSEFLDNSCHPARGRILCQCSDFRGGDGANEGKCHYSFHPKMFWRA